MCCSFESNEISKVNLIKKEYSRILSETEALENLKEESKNRKDDDEEEVSLFDGSDDMGRTYDNDTWSVFNEECGKRKPKKKPLKKPHPLKK